MKAYGKLENGVLKYAPRNYETIDGLIINFNQNEELMKQYEFKEIVDVYPSVGENQHFEFDKYTENETSITVNYKVIEEEIDNSMEVNPIEARMNSIEDTNTTQDILIDTTMVATDEVFMLLEPLLGDIQSVSEKSVSGMVNFYVVMVKRGLKTIEEIPERYREEVSNRVSK